MTAVPIDHREALVPGTEVEVVGRYQQGWVTGFRVALVHAADDMVVYQLRRNSDGAILPAIFDADTIRAKR